MEDKSRSRAEGTVIVTASAFPINLWDKWNEDCEKTFGDCRWIKMWNDHLEAKNSKVLKELLDNLENLNKKVLDLEKKIGGN